jgi:uncharacterized protein (TIGR02271 family)
MQTVIAAFEDRAQAERARDTLISRGFDRSDMHIEHPGGSGEMTGAATETETRSGSGGISGFFSRLFGSDEDTYGSTWSEAVRRGRCVLVVDAQDERQADEAVSSLNASGALDIDEQARQWREQGWSGAGKDAATPAMRSDASAAPQESLKVVQEELKVGKRRVDQGGVRVVQRVSAKPVREILHLREERAVVERTPVDRPATAADLGTFKEGTMEVRESNEEAVVAKTARVVEEVRVGKEVREREEVIEDKLRRKDVDIERLPADERERAHAANPRPSPLGDPDTTGERLGQAPKPSRKKPGTGSPR